MRAQTTPEQKAMRAQLVRIAALLNGAGVTWALGASMLLHFKGLVRAPRDIDLMVAVKDIQAADGLLCSLGQKQPPNPSAGYATRFFYEYGVAGVDVDVMAGFVIRHTGGEYAYHLDPDALETMCLEGVPVPLCPLEDWLALYLLMGRDERADQAEGYLRRQGADPKRLRFWLGQALPPAVKQRVESLL